MSKTENFRKTYHHANEGTADRASASISSHPVCTVLAKSCMATWHKSESVAAGGWRKYARATIDLFSLRKLVP